MIWALIGIAVIALGVVLYLYNQKNKEEKQEEVRQLTDSLKEDGSSIKNAEPGDFVQIDAISELSLDYKEVIYEVHHVHRYQCYDEKWFEVTGKVGDQPYRIEWYEDEGLQISGNNQVHPMRISDLGITEEDLARMDDEESDENYIHYDGQRYYYDYSDEVFFYEDNKGEGEGFYMWEFVSEDRKKSISVEKWEGEPFEIYVSYVMDPSHVVLVKR